MSKLKISGGLLFFSLLASTHVVGADSGHAEHHHHEHIDYSREFATPQPAQDISSERCWVRLMPANVPSAGYFSLSNNQKKPIELLAARTDNFNLTMLHLTYEDEGMAKMKETTGIIIEPAQRLDFEPGGYHVMFEEPTKMPKVGEEIDLELLFADDQKITMSCRVNAAKARSYDEE